MRIRQKNCAHCQKLTEVCYRIQHDPSRQWRLVCPDCRLILVKNNPYYRYGGTWKAIKKKLSRYL